MISPAPIISKTPGNSVEKGASVKNNQPNTNETGMPKYSKTDTLDGSANLYEITRHKTPMPPQKPMSANR